MHDTVKILQEEGNAHYACGRYDAARASYTTAIDILNAVYTTKVNDLPIRDSIVPWEALTLSQLLSNRAQTAIQERNFKAALNDATQALQYNTKNEKALRRKLVALENLEKFEVALALIDKILNNQRQYREEEGDKDESYHSIVPYWVAARRRVRNNLSKDREVAASEVKQMGNMVHDNQQLRINFGCLLPSQVPLKTSFNVNVNIGNEFGLFRRDYVEKGKHIYLHCSLRNNSNGRYKLVFQEPLDLSGVDDQGSVDATGRIMLNNRGKASFQVAIVTTDIVKGDVLSNQLALEIRAHVTSIAKWNLFPVVSLPFTVVNACGDLKEGDSGGLGVHCCRPVSMAGLQHDILLAESPGNLGIGGKLWDSCLVLTRYLAARRELLVGKEVVELGSGLGLVGIFCSKLGARVTLTDVEEVVPLLDYNIRLNYTERGEANTSTQSFAKDDAVVQVFPVARAHLWGKPPRDLPTQPDMLVLSDVVYDPEGYAPLVASMSALAISPDTLVLMAHRSRNPIEHQFFELLSQSFTCKEIDWLSTEKSTSEAAPAGGLSSGENALQDVKIFEIRRLVGCDRA
ncbi:unnamed protein product [Peronospora belbahrii]|uniref:Uncharacterized protein n=1 Tax=Peronospora belbahrii TaxID=622444 RepID=A0AAU9KV04_9STRA|nr:unnamed protein product [Peronospora belbahrii]CAH0514634.1 unnamed protein product [Peronospora belbahrii]